METSKETRIAFSNILNTMGSVDGGARFVRLKCFIEDFDKKAQLGDEHAQQIIDVMKRFSRLINFANKFEND